MAGLWRLARAIRAVTVDPFLPLSAEVQAGVEAEARDIARFLA
ncbi:MAG: hypothetical protein RMM58_12555 [Chloroflexota bacterium]|nr:hypothetical protein [Dehalococcoidia bacterium]MDW8254699.1 hypothetical protein [Chloroflexota bacterium]